MVNALMKIILLCYFKILGTIWIESKVKNYFDLINTYFRIYENLYHAPWTYLKNSLPISQEKYYKIKNKKIRRYVHNFKKN